MLPTDAGFCLLGLARASMAAALGCAGPDVDLSAHWLQDPAASFVTLTQHGQLRGCMGSLQAHRSLLQDVRSNAVAAALHDPRFSPLRAADLDTVRIEVSVLSAPEPIDVPSEPALRDCLRPGVDGVVLHYGAHRATFLPQVWEQLPQPAEFLAQLKHKAGLHANVWSTEMRWQRYTVQKWSEPPL